MSRISNVVSIDSADRAGLLARRDALVESNLDLVAPIARSILASLPPSFELDDLVSAGNLGLLQAATRYRPAAHADTPFSAYARPVIRGAILDSIRRNAWREANHDDYDALPEQRCAVVPIDETIDARRRRQRINAAIATLPERHQSVISWHYDDETSLRSVGERLGVGKSRASQLHMEAVRELRETLA